MVFSSTIFLCVYLPLVLLGYYICPKKGRNLFLLIVSLVFYAWGEPKYVFLMIFSILVNYIFGRLMDKHRENKKRLKLMLVLSVVIDIGLLSVFKYTDFIITNVNAIFGANFDLLNIALPIGISFYTFQAMSYTIDVYRNDVRVQKNLIDFGMYITMFPQLIAGPIVRYADVQDQLADRSVTTADFSEGVMRFVVGLGKKVLLANQMGAVWSDIYALGGDVSALMAWTGAIAYTFQIYFDFSGYSDMAIGLGRMFGFKFPENFRYPYQSVSITDFWRRWHITLSTWFKEYLYIPLGGNRRGLARQALNLLIVWSLTGFWHGAGWNFVMWGLYYFVILFIEKLFLLKALDKLPKFFRHVYALLLIIIGWVIFASDDVSVLLPYLGSMFGANGAIGGMDVYTLLTKAVLLIICCIASTELPKKLFLSAAGAMNEKAAFTLKSVLMIALLALSMILLIGDSYNPFLYFRF
ncbi:MAG: MBOAT family O-acyltransferase [Oscillospiraceae bacterium]|nr:MBOAT family O-acyltransferase [Oscillospiraceae bacterium]